MTQPLRIVSSCGVPWESMSPRTGGRHCARCDRVVVDVRGLPRAEAIAKLAAVKRERGDVCGRATVDAETHALVFAAPPAMPRRLPWKGVLLAAALSAGCEHAVNAASARPVALLAPQPAPKPGVRTEDSEPLPPPPPAPGELADAPDAGVADAAAPDGGRHRRRRHVPRPIVDEVGYMTGDF